MDLESATRNFTSGIARPTPNADYLTANCRLSRKCEILDVSEPMGLQVC
jgi:hypothetical protein